MEHDFILLLNAIDGVGIQTIKKIIEKNDFEKIKTIEDFKVLVQKEIGIECLERIKILIKNRYQENLIEELKDNEISYVNYLDSKYPKLLKEIYDPPAVLFYKGNVELLNNFSIGIIGSRNPSPYGVFVAKKFANDLSEIGITIISGLANGIDSSGHYASLDKKGSTIAVLGSSIDRPYPKRNKKLLESIIENNGCVISEHPIKIDPLPGFFPRRNRIISGMSQGIVVVEAGQRSGSLITCDFALEQGKNIFSIPGNINSNMSKGTNELIKKGAILTTSINDILEEYPNFSSVDFKKNDKLKNLSQLELLIVEFLEKQGPSHVDEVSLKLRIPIKDVVGVLNILEIKGIVLELRGKTYDINL